jgi:hypothetical protein
MVIKTCDAAETPAWQADPFETQIPAWSSKKSNESPEHPGKVK